MLSSAPTVYGNGTELWVQWGDDCIKVENVITSSFELVRDPIDITTQSDYGRVFTLGPSRVEVTLRGISATFIKGKMPNFRDQLDKLTVNELFEAIQRKLDKR